jgi:hypothetical protein
MAVVVIAFLAGVFAGARWTDHSARSAAAHGQEVFSRPTSEETHWLPDSSAGWRDRLERHLRGLDVAMMEIGHRFNELHFAGRDRNWPYARYQIEKIELALRLSLERRPQRAAAAEPFLRETIPLVKQAIHAADIERNTGAYEEALERLRADCMKCHVAENVPHFTVYFAKYRTSPIGPGDERD